MSICDTGLTTRYQYISNESEGVSACRDVQLHGNSSHPAPKDLFVSCPFSGDSYEGLPYRLEYDVVGDDFAFSRKYVFYVPLHRSIGRSWRESAAARPDGQLFANRSLIPFR